MDHSVFRFIDDVDDTTLIMRNLPKLTSFTSGERKSWTFLRPHHAILKNMPKLTRLKLPRAFKYRDDIQIDNADAFSEYLEQPLPDSDDDCCIL